MRDKIRAKRRKILFILSILVLYVILHEAGHCIAVIACGGTVTEFSILTAHMSYIGGEGFSGAQNMWINVNGMLFPLILSFVYMLFYKKDSTNSIYRIVSAAAIIPIGSLVAWVVVPLLYLSGSAPADDDCTKFLYNFSVYHSPFIVTICALLLISLAAALVIKKRLFKNFIGEIRSKADT